MSTNPFIDAVPTPGPAVEKIRDAEKSSPASPSKRRNRAQAFRKKMSDKVTKAVHDEINDRHTAPLAAYFESLRLSKSTGTETTIAVPVTTRGLGLNLSLLWTHLEERANQAVNRSQCTQFNHYRYTLLQFAHQIYQGYTKRSGEIDFRATESIVQYVDANKLQNITNKKNFGLLSDAIDQVGKIHSGNTEYYCYVPFAKRERPQQEPTTSKAPIFGKRSRTNEELPIRPNPYLITIHNLRDTVISLADVNTDPARRLAFRRLNPIPGAVWNDANVLLNPNLIMPENYDVVQVATDFRKVTSLIENIKQKDKMYIRECALEGDGSPTVLLWTMTPDDINWSVESIPPELEVREPIHHASTFVPMCAALLMCERPISNGGIDFKELEENRWNLRSVEVSRKYCDGSWLALAEHILNYTG